MFVTKPAGKRSGLSETDSSAPENTLDSAYFIQHQTFWRIARIAGPGTDYVFGMEWRYRSPDLFGGGFSSDRIAKL